MKPAPPISAAAWAAVLAVIAGCTSPIATEDPLATLHKPNDSPRRHMGAMDQLDAQPADDAYVQALEQVLWRPGYTLDVREAAFDRLDRIDEVELKATIRRRLPGMSARAWQERLCELIVERNWTDLSPALVSAWAVPIGFVNDFDRAEYKALVELFGADNVIDVVFVLLIESSKESQQGLRVRCWELLHRLGQRQRLMELIADQTVSPDDAMLLDIRAAAVDLGVVPSNREEILWIRTLRQPEYAEFWAKATAVVAQLPDDRRADLELRDLPILVAASIHDPWLLAATKDELYDRVSSYVASQREHVDPGRFEGLPGTYPQHLYEHRRQLTWGDLAAMLQAVRAMEVSQVVEHLFDYAERDRLDESCEYGGVIALDEFGRFEILEFPPRFRRRDNEFIASQAMMDAAYTALFQFHNHAQRHRNQRYAGPGLGDVRYADNTRANCLVFTFINEDTMNVDFYRHDRVIVDLGEIKRPG